MDWLELSVEATPEAVDWVCTALTRAGSFGNVRIAEGPTGELIVRAYRRQDGRQAGDLRRLEEELAPLRRVGMIGSVWAEPIAGPPRGRACRAPLRRIGQRLLLASAGTVVATAPDDVVVRLGSEAAFGSGYHPATVAGLRLLERHVQQGMEALDLGSGSGILSVALAKLGARVLALDNDPAAVRATRAAVRLNGVGEAVTVRRGSLGRGARLGHWTGGSLPGRTPAVAARAQFDLIAANVLARMHADLADEYRNALRSVAIGPGVLIATGFTVDQEADVDGALRENGFAPLDREQIADYVGLAHRLGG